MAPQPRTVTCDRPVIRHHQLHARTDNQNSTLYFSIYLFSADAKRVANLGLPVPEVRNYFSMSRVRSRKYLRLTSARFPGGHSRAYYISLLFSPQCVSFSFRVCVFLFLFNLRRVRTLPAGSSVLLGRACSVLVNGGQLKFPLARLRKVGGNLILFHVNVQSFALYNRLRLLSLFFLRILNSSFWGVKEGFGREELLFGRWWRVLTILLGLQTMEVSAVGRGRWGC